MYLDPNDPRNVRAYYCFTRTWWRIENGRKVPGAGRRHTIAKNVTRDEALAICKVWNSEHKPGKLSRKCEFDVQSR